MLTVRLCFMQIHLTVIHPIHAIFQPYKRKMHNNIIDTLLFTNLAIINGITLYNFQEKSISILIQLSIK